MKMIIILNHFIINFNSYTIHNKMIDIELKNLLSKLLDQNRTNEILIKILLEQTAKLLDHANESKETKNCSSSCFSSKVKKNNNPN